MAGDKVVGGSVPRAGRRVVATPAGSEEPTVGL